MLDLFTTAVAQKRCLKINYDPGERIVEPHAVGYSKDGHILVRVYQQSGASRSGKPTDWKLFRLDEMRAANDNGTTFNGPREGYKKGDSAMKGGIISEL